MQEIVAILLGVLTVPPITLSLILLTMLVEKFVHQVMTWLWYKPYFKQPGPGAIFEFAKNPHKLTVVGYAMMKLALYMACVPVFAWFLEQLYKVWKMFNGGVDPTLLYQSSIPWICFLTIAAQVAVVPFAYCYEEWKRQHIVIVGFTDRIIGVVTEAPLLGFPLPQHAHNTSSTPVLAAEELMTSTTGEEFMVKGKKLSAPFRVWVRFMAYLFDVGCIYIPSKARLASDLFSWFDHHSDLEDVITRILEDGSLLRDLRAGRNKGLVDAHLGTASRSMSMETAANDATVFARRALDVLPQLPPLEVGRVGVYPDVWDFKARRRLPAAKLPRALQLYASVREQSMQSAPVPVTATETVLPVPVLAAAPVASEPGYDALPEV